MAIKINFDLSHNPEPPTLILTNRSGLQFGNIKSKDISVKDCLNDVSNISFEIKKEIDGKKNILWDKVKDFKLAWCKEWDKLFQLKVETEESNETTKSVYGTGLEVSELSQIMLYDIEVNTETDIERDDYKPTILYNKSEPKTSLLNRLLKDKAPHYSIIHVDPTIANIQRTFTFNDISIYDAFQEVAQEIDCLFVFHSYFDDNAKIIRTISVYDLESNCIECGHRGEFTDSCPECGSKEINEGYGKDTTIFVTSDELGNDIQFTSNTDSIKNCFKLEGGDDLMTATIRNCNPNGSDYIWYISEDMKEDMSEELAKRLDSYDKLYEHFQNEYVAEIDNTLLSQYNILVEKYQKYNSRLEKIETSIIGYPTLMTAYYNTVDLTVYLQTSMMPDTSLSDTNASKQASLLTRSNLSPVSVTSVDTISSATADNAVLAMAKVVVDSRYQVKVNTSSLNSNIWTGNFKVTNYSDEEDTAISSTISVDINDNYESFVKQKIEKALSKENVDNVSITGLFSLDHSTFCSEIKKYALSSLTRFIDCCQSCIDILIEQGIADQKTWSSSNPNLYDNLYRPYYQKLKSLQSESSLRQSEIDTILGVYDSEGGLLASGIQTEIIDIKNQIQSKLNFQNYLGNDLWLEFCTYRREDKYSSDNYISDGLNNAELFERALEFIEDAKKEIYKSAELQHSISTSLKNLLVIEKFQPLVENFEVGNWLRVQVDETVYKLRLLSYEVDYDNLENISVEFSDVMKIPNGASDTRSVLSQAKSMGTTYKSTQRQAEQGAKSNTIVSNWVEKGLDASNTKIIGGADDQTQTWDSHGMLFRKYDSIADDYDPCQMKITNSTLAITDDGWKTVRSAVGGYYYTDPTNHELKYAYGINAETLVGKLILGEQLGIYNDSGSLSFDEDGLTITNGSTSFKVDPNDDTFLAISNGKKDIFYVKDGQLFISGSGIDLSDNPSNINTIEVQYALSESPTTPPKNGWSTTAPEWKDGMYMWQKTVTIYGDGSRKESDATCISGAKGQNGDGVGIQSTVVTYQASNNGTTPPTGTWQTTIPSTSAGQYLWTRTIITYTDKKTSTLYSVGRNGTNGTNGSNGIDGKGIESITNYYLASTSGSGVTTSTSGWTTTIQTISKSKRYLWNYEVVKYTDTSTTTTTPIIIGTYGDTGATGKGITSINEYYLVSANASGITTSTSGWSTNVVTTTTTNKYLWNYEKITYTDGSTQSTTPKIIGTHGATGSKGDTGIGVKSIIPQYYLSTSSMTQTDGSWSNDEPTWENGKYIWTRSYITWTDNTTSTTTPVLASALNSANSAADSALSKANEVDKTILSWCMNNDTTYINGAKIYTGSITANQIAANAITADKLAANSVTATKIAAGAITADKIAANSITADKLLISTNGYSVNPNFANWTGNTPFGFSDWQNSYSSGRLTKVILNQQNLIQMTTGTEQTGLIAVRSDNTSSYWNYNLSLNGVSYVAVEIKFRLINGTNPSGAGALIDFGYYNSSNTLTYGRVGCALTDLGTSLTTNTWYTFKKVIQVPTAATSGQFQYLRSYLMGNYTSNGLGALTSKTIQFATFNVYKATEQDYLTQSWTSGTSINGASVATGTITATQLAANAVTAAKLATDAIKSTNYSYSSGDFSKTGSFLNLSNGEIRTPNFYSGSSGASFSGNIESTSGNIGGFSIYNNCLVSYYEYKNDGDYRVSGGTEFSAGSSNSIGKGYAPYILFNGWGDGTTNYKTNAIIQVGGGSQHATGVSTFDYLMLSMHHQNIVTSSIKLGQGGIELSGDITFKGAIVNELKFNTGTRTEAPLKVWGGDSNGMGIAIGAGGRTIIGGGESANNLKNNVYSATAQSEELDLSSDSIIRFLTNCNTIANRLEVLLDGSRNFYPVSGGTSGAGSIGTNANRWMNGYFNNLILTTSGLIESNNTNAVTGGEIYSYLTQHYQAGTTNITPTAANTVTSVTIKFNKEFSKTPIVVASVATTVPNTCTVGTSNASTTQFTIYFTRTNTTATAIRWFATDLY